MSKGKGTPKPKGYADGVPVYCAHDAIAKVAELRPNPKNPNKHPDEQIRALGQIIREGGWRQPITVSTLSGCIVKGHGRLAAAQHEGLSEAPVDYQDYASEAEEFADLVADNRLAELAELDQAMLADIFAEIDASDVPVSMTGYSQEEAEKITAAFTDALGEGAAAEGQDEIEEPPEPEDAVTQRGDLWILGRHRVVCGDSTSEADRALLLDGAHPEILLTDPPYCSGGFQESDRRAGSIGTTREAGPLPTIAADMLSTRGYQVLIKSVLGALDVKVAYIFTDWRMWIYLFDLVEGCGLGVRSMIVWNKKFPGMGNGWRAQHELVMFAHRTKPKWDNHKGYGNVLEVARSGNELHPTQKPVEILDQLLDNTQWADGVIDPFGGSGSTLIAAENAGQPSFIMELDPRYVDVIVRRYVRESGDFAGVKLYRKGEAIGRDQFERLFK